MVRAVLWWLAGMVLLSGECEAGKLFRRGDSYSRSTSTQQTVQKVIPPPVIPEFDEATATRENATRPEIIELEDGTISLEQFAQPQINQCESGTCAYNAPTGIMEVLYAMRSGRKLDFSEPFFVATAPEFNSNTDWYWKVYDNYDDESGVLANGHLPTEILYPHYNELYATRGFVNSLLSKLRPRRLRLGFRMRATPIFFHAHWDGDNLKIDQWATREELNKAITWFRDHKRPVNVHYRWGTVWHSVILLGHQPANRSRAERVLIKDSKGAVGVGDWIASEEFVKTCYAAIGVTEY